MSWLMLGETELRLNVQLSNRLPVCWQHWVLSLPLTGDPKSFIQPFPITQVSISVLDWELFFHKAMFLFSNLNSTFVERAKYKAAFQLPLPNALCFKVCKKVKSYQVCLLHYFYFIYFQLSLIGKSSRKAWVFPKVKFIRICIFSSSYNASKSERYAPVDILTCLRRCEWKQSEYGEEKHLINKFILVRIWSENCWSEVKHKRNMWPFTLYLHSLSYFSLGVQWIGKGRQLLQRTASLKPQLNSAPWEELSSPRMCRGRSCYSLPLRERHFLACMKLPCDVACTDLCLHGLGSRVFMRSRLPARGMLLRDKADRSSVS